MGKLTAFIDNLIPDAQAVFRRFPLAILMVALFTMCLIGNVGLSMFNDETMFRFVSGTILAAYLAVTLTLIGEGRGKPVSVIVKAIVCGLALLAGYYYRELLFVTPMAIGASILYLGSAPFFRAGRDDVAVWDFTHKLWTAVIFTVAGSVIYLLGLLAIGAALKSLFSVRIDNLIQDWLLPIGLGFLAPVCWMAMLPRHDEDDGDTLRNPAFISRAVGFLGTWILAPLTLIYAIILIAYGIKIVLSMSLPNGEIAQLVTPFLIIGTLTWLILDPPFIQEKRLARWYSKIWFPLIIPASILLAVAVFIRINEYGWTVERYLLVLASVWALGIALWFTFRGEAKRDIRIIPSFAALLLAIGSIGPWGADQFSAINQNSRLTQALKANDMLDASGKLKSLDQLVITNDEAAQKAKGALSYLINQRKERRIQSYFPETEIFELKASNSYKGRLDSANIFKRFELDDVRIMGRYGYSNISYTYQNPHQNIQIMDYDYLTLPVHLNLDRKHDYENTKSIGDYSIVTKKGVMIVKTGETELSRFDVLNWLDAQEKLPDNKLELEPRRVLYSEGDVEIAIHITNAQTNSDDQFASNLQYMMLAKGVIPADD
jgi:hypothetical protein